MKLLQPINEFSLKPLCEAVPPFTLKYCKINSSAADSFKVRFLFVVQVISSLVVIPIFLIIGLLATTLNLCNDPEADNFDDMWGYLKLHSIFIIPTAVVGVAAPWATTVRIAIDQAECLGKSLIPNELGFPLY